KSLTLRPWISAARLTMASTSGAMRASMRAVRVSSCDIRSPSFRNVMYGSPPDIASPGRSNMTEKRSQGRDQNLTAELAVDAGGKFLGLRWTGSHNVGAYIEGAARSRSCFH